jgi:hypothetical protein
MQVIYKIRILVIIISIIGPLILIKLAIVAWKNLNTAGNDFPIEMREGEESLLNIIEEKSLEERNDYDVEQIQKKMKTYIIF